MAFSPQAAPPSQASPSTHNVTNNNLFANTINGLTWGGFVPPPVPGHPSAYYQPHSGQPTAYSSNPSLPQQQFGPVAFVNANTNPTSNSQSSHGATSANTSLAAMAAQQQSAASQADGLFSIVGQRTEDRRDGPSQLGALQDSQVAPPKKTMSSIQEAVRSSGSTSGKPRNWKKLHPKSWESAASEIDSMVDRVVSETGQSSSSVRGDALLTARKRRNATTWNLVQKHIDVLAEPYGLPVRIKGQKYNVYINSVLSPAYKKLQGSKSALFLKLVEDCKTLNKAGASAMRTSVQQSVTKLRQEGNWLLKRAIDLENNHAIPMISIAFHPHPNARPVIVATEYGWDKFKKAFAKMLSTDGPNELISRIDTEIKQERPLSYLAAGEPEILVRTDSFEPPPGLPPTFAAAKIPNTASGIGSSAPTTPTTPTRIAANPASSVAQPSSGSSTSADPLTNATSSSANQAAPTSRHRLGSTIIAWPRPKLMRILCERGHMPEHSSDLIQHVAFQLLQFLSDAILDYDRDVGDANETRYGRWMQFTQGMTTLRYHSLFDDLACLGFIVDGWPNDAGNLLPRGDYAVSLHPAAMIVSSGGILEPTSWTEQNALAIAECRQHSLLHYVR
ncbi:hypothetical protein CF319_g4342 [Tilletia indica]|nr:hypothetical protein CF319_g4342 [Tilletia indica]